MKLVTIVGARPQFVKAAAVSREINRLKSLGEDVDEIIIHTGQHFDSNMSDIFFKEMSIPEPHYNLHINSLSHGAMTGQMLEKIEAILIDLRPDYVLVYGDTNSTLAGALAAKKLHIKVAHIEAGLRSFNMKMPEEVNRVLTDRISDVLFAPTARSVDNLMDEGYGDMGVAVVNSGDVMYDVSEYYASYAKCPAFMNDSTDLPFVLCTIHRAENTDDKERLASIIGELNEISKKMKVVFPLHPRTRNMLVKYGLDVSKLHITEPVGYFEIAWLLQNCAFVVTDSGGLQKEAYFHKKTCIILREETEWIELVNCGCNALVGSKVTGILDKYEHLTKSCSFEQNLYGSGDASKKIIKYLINEGR